MDRARAALRDAAAELRTFHIQNVAQNPQQWRIGGNVDGFGLAVDRKGVGHGSSTPQSVE
jgi:hypothetical protein